MSLSYTSNAENYQAVRDVILKYAENRTLAVAVTQDPNALSHIHDDNDTEPGGNLTIGYGLNLDNNALSADDVVDAIEYALTEDVSPPEEALNAAQEAGLLLLHEWKSGTHTDAYMLDLVSRTYDPTKHSETQNTHRAYLESLALNDEQATRLLHASIGGLKDESNEYILPNREDGLTNRLSGQNKWEINAGAVPESNERAALMSLYYNAPDLIGKGLLTAIATDNRAEAWWEIRYNSNGEGPDVADGIAMRRYYESQVFGLFSDYDSLDLSELDKDALRDSEARGVFRMVSLQRDESLEAYDDEFDTQIANANSKENGWNTAVTGFEVQTREEAFETAEVWLVDHYVTPLGQAIDEIVFDAPSTINGTNPTPGAINRESTTGTDYLFFGEAGADTLRGGGGNDAIYGDHGSCQLDTTLGSGADKLYGGDGNDVLIGGGGNDELEGGIGNDTIYGDDHAQLCEPFGADTMTGGSGDDKFIIEGNDVITDPQVGDRIGFLDGDGKPIWLEGGYLAGGDEEDTGDGRDEYTRIEGLYYEETHYGTVAYEWEEGGDCLTIFLPDESVIHVHDWENGKAGINLRDTPDDDKVDESDNLGSPLVLDLDGDGIELIEVHRSHAYFDLDQDGFAENTGWVAPDDGLLALDLNSNGTIDDISELFGVEGTWDYDQLYAELNNSGKLPSGFDKLRLLDSNSDGVIDAADSAFDDLRVWQDLNGDGVSQAGELSSLSTLGIASLSLTSTQEIVQDGSNAITDFGTFTRTDSSTGDMVDVWFGYDGHVTKDLTPTAIDPATANLPKLHAYGEAGSLSEAMSADSQLLSLVTDFKNLTVADAAELETRVEDILLRWYGADGIDPLSRGDNVDARWMTALEHIYGDQWSYPSGSPNPNSNGGALLAEAWRDYKSTILVQLLAQTPLGQTLFPGLAFSGMAFLTLPDTLSLEDVLGNLSASAPTDGIEKLQYWHSMILALDALYPEFKELLPPPGEEEEEVDFEPIFIDAIETALAAAGIAYSYEQLRGGDLGTAGNDMLVGVGSTYDPDLDPDLRFEALLVGADGNDTYLVGSATFGPGIDIVVEGTDAGTDTVKSWESYTLTANVENLTLLGTTGLSGAGNDLGNLIVGNTGGNNLTGLGGADTLEGGGGDDTLQGGDGADSISLGTGKDRVSFASVLEAGDIVTGFTTSGTEQDTINLDALFDALNGGISSAARAGRVQLVETGTDVELRIDTAAGTGAGDGVGDVTLMVFAGMTSAAGLSVGNLSTSDIQVGTA